MVDGCSIEVRCGGLNSSDEGLKFQMVEISVM
jgi:hypothetical protein